MVPEKNIAKNLALILGLLITDLRKFGF